MAASPTIRHRVRVCQVMCDRQKRNCIKNRNRCYKKQTYTFSIYTIIDTMRKTKGEFNLQMQSNSNLLILTSEMLH